MTLGLEFICRSENKALEIWIGTFGIEIDHVFYYGNTVRCWTGCWKVLSTSLHWYVRVFYKIIFHDLMDRIFVTLLSIALYKWFNCMFSIYLLAHIVCLKKNDSKMFFQEGKEWCWIVACTWDIMTIDDFQISLLSPEMNH